MVTKIVFEDNEITKVIRGTIIREDDFTYDIKTLSGDLVTIGKRAIIQIQRGD